MNTLKNVSILGAAILATSAVNASDLTYAESEATVGSAYVMAATSGESQQPTLRAIDEASVASAFVQQPTYGKATPVENRALREATVATAYQYNAAETTESAAPKVIAAVGATYAEQEAQVSSAYVMAPTYGESQQPALRAIGEATVATAYTQEPTYGVQRPAENYAAAEATVAHAFDMKGFEEAPYGNTASE